MQQYTNVSERNPFKGLVYICALSEAWLQTVSTTQDGPCVFVPG